MPDPNSEIFLTYLKRFPPSIGQRFLLVHTERHGIEAVEKFWDKVCVAHSKHQKTIKLSKEEKDSLAHVLAEPTSRRKLLIQGAGAIVASCGAYKVFRKALEDAGHIDQNASYDARMEALKTYFTSSEVVIDFGLTAIGLADIGIVQILHQQKLHTLINGEKKEAVRDLIAVLDACFRPLTAIINETRPFNQTGIPSR